MNLKDIVVLSETPEDEALLDKAESAFAQVRATTKNIKYDDTAIEILSKVGTIADELSQEEVMQELEYLERAVFDAKNNLESTVYGLEEPFEDLIRTLRNKIDDEELDREYNEESKFAQPEPKGKSMLDFMREPPQEKFQYKRTESPITNFEKYFRYFLVPRGLKVDYQEAWQNFKKEFGHMFPQDDNPNFMDETEKSILSAMARPLGEDPTMLNPAIDGEFINWLKNKSKDKLFPLTLDDMANKRVLELMKQMYYKETGLYPGDGGATATDAAKARAKAAGDSLQTHSMHEDEGNMIGEPDDYYDAEERIQAYNDLQDALQGNYMDDYIKDGACPACGGNGYQDGEEEVYNDETDEYEEGTECDGFGMYGCDEGEMTYGSDGPSWVEIMRHDERQKERAELAAKPQPSDDLLYKSAKHLHKEYVIDRGTHNAFEISNLLRQMYPEISKPKAREIGARVLGDYKQESINEGTKSEKAVRILVDMFNDGLENFSSEEELEAEVSRQASDLTQLLGDFDTGKATEDALTQLRDYNMDDYPGSIDRDYDARYEGKSPHKKGTKKYKKHMAAMHAGEGVLHGPTKKNMRLKELSPARDNSANEQKVAELIKKALKDPQGQDAYDLYAELESTNPELADLYKDVALHQYEVNLEEGKGAIRGGLAALLLLLGLNTANEFTSAKNTPLGQDLKVAAQQGGEHSDIAKFYYKNLDLYVEENDMRTLVNLKIMFDNDDPRFNPARDDVEDFLRDQARLPEPTNERKFRDQGVMDVVTDRRGKEFKFDKDSKQFKSLDGEIADPKTPLGKDLMRLRRNQMKRTTPSYNAKLKTPGGLKTVSKESWSPEQAGRKYWWSK